MNKVRDLAIVLRSVPYEERHRVVTALTENHGKVSGLARNAIQSRRFGGTLEPFVASSWIFVERPGADLVRIEEAEVRRTFEGLRKDFERLAEASVFNELMLKLAPEREACPELFRLHSNALVALEELPGSGVELSLLNGYMAKLLQWCGNHPQLRSCMGCQLPLESFWEGQTGLRPGAQEATLTCVVADAGWFCSSCRETQTRHLRDRSGQSLAHSSLMVSPAAITDFFMSLASPIRQVPGLAQADEQGRRGLFHFLEGLFLYHIPGFDRAPLKGLRFLGL